MADVEIIKEVVQNRYGYPTINYTCPEKTKSTYSIVKSKNGFSFLSIEISHGVLPKALEGQFTREAEAEKCLLNYLKNMKTTAAVERDNKTARRIAQKEEA
jgi:hypothetical protein